MTFPIETSWLLDRGHVVHFRAGMQFPPCVLMHPYDFVVLMAQEGHVHEALDKLSKFVSQEANIKYRASCEKLDRMYPNER